MPVATKDVAIKKYGFKNPTGHQKLPNVELDVARGCITKDALNKSIHASFGHSLKSYYKLRRQALWNRSKGRSPDIKQESLNPSSDTCTVISFDSDCLR